jgi:hypothetical protein
VNLLPAVAFVVLPSVLLLLLLLNCSLQGILLVCSSKWFTTMQLYLYTACLTAALVECLELDACTQDARHALLLAMCVCVFNSGCWRHAAGSCQHCLLSAAVMATQMANTVKEETAGRQSW